MMSSETYDAILNTLKRMGIRETFNKVYIEELSKLLPEDLLPSSGIAF